MVLPIQGNGEDLEVSTEQASPILLIEASEGIPVVIPGGGWLLSADMVRQGPDLLLVGADGSKVLIRDYFNLENPPSLMTESGAVITSAQVTTFAGPLAPGQYAQAASTSLAEPIGQVITASGTVEAVRADGTRVILSEGDSVYQGDILETAEDGAVNIEFADASTFSLGESGRMVLDEMVYDPGVQEGSFQISIAQGVFSFISGEVAKTSPDSMVLNTPVATIGIRGTTLIGQAGDVNTVTLLPDANGDIGEIVISNSATVLIINLAGGTVTIAGVGQPISEAIILTREQIELIYGDSILTPLQNVLEQLTFQPDIGNEASAEALVEKILQGQATDDSVINFETASGGDEEEDPDLGGLQALADAAALLIANTDPVPPGGDGSGGSGGGGGGDDGTSSGITGTTTTTTTTEGGGGGGGGGGSSTVNGSAIDGYITGATVFADTNDDGILDAGEASAVTGLGGNFSLVDGTGPLVMFGGTDTATGLDFEAILRAPAGSTVVTPVTTLIDALMDAGQTLAEAEAHVQILFDTPISADITQTDPIAALISGDPDGGDLFATGAGLLNAAILGGSLISGASQGTVDIATATDAIFAEIAALMISSGGTEDFSSLAVVAQIITDAGAQFDVDVSALADDTAFIIQEIDDAIDAVVAGGTGNVTAFLTKITQVSIVAQGDAADALVLAGSSGDLSGALNGFTGSALTSAIADAASQVGDVDGPGVDSFNAAPEILVDGSSIESHGFGGNILFVSDSGAGSDIGAVLEGDGHTVTYVLNDFEEGYNSSLLGDLSGYTSIFWSASGHGSGDQHSDSEVFDNLTSFVEAGGSVFVTGYDSIASPGDPLLINFLGGADSYDSSSDYEGPDSPALGGTSLTSGVVDIGGVTPTGNFDDTDTLLDLNEDTITVVSGNSDSEGGSGASWSLRTLGNGEIAYVSNGDYDSYDSHPSWTDTSEGGDGAYNAAIRNFAFNSSAARLSTDEDTSLPLSNITISDVDSSAGPLTVTLSVVSGMLNIAPGHGLASVVSSEDSSSVIVSGTQAAINAALASFISYDPADDFNGTDSLTISVDDTTTSSGYSVTSQTIDIYVAPVNDAPDTMTDTAIVNEDGSITISVLGNDSDVDGDTLSVSNLTQGSNGSVDLNEDGSVTYTPEPNFFGEDTFTYTASDGQGGTTEETVTITVNSVIEAPEISITSGTDGVLRIAVIGGNALATEEEAAAQLNDSTDFAFEAVSFDATDYSTAAEWTIALAGYDAVVIGGSGYRDTEYATSNLYPALADFVDNGGGVVTTGFYGLSVSYASEQLNDALYISPLSASGYSYGSVDVITVLNSTYAITEGVSDFTGAVLWTPGVTNINATATILATSAGGTYAAFDTIGDANLAYLGSLFIGGAPFYDTTGLRSGVEDQLFEQTVAWTADQSFFVTNEETPMALEGLTISDIDAGDGLLMVTLGVVNGVLNVSGIHGLSGISGEGTNSLTFSGSQSDINAALVTNIAYLGNTDFFGDDTLSISVDDSATLGGGAVTTTSTVITVEPVNDAPVAVADNIITNITDGSAIDIPSFVLTGNDTDVDGDTFIIESASTAWAGATATVDGVGDVQFTPPAEFADSSETFSYTVSDGMGKNAEATVDVTFHSSTIFNGTASDEIVIGGAANDQFYGNGGDDILLGGGGNDTLAGGAGSDTLFGGSGSDIFGYYSATESGLGAGVRDVIGDFDATGVDLIDIVEFAAGTFSFLGASSNAFTGSGGVEANFNDVTKILQIDADGDAIADIEIELTDVALADLDQNDFSYGAA